MSNNLFDAVYNLTWTARSVAIYVFSHISRDKIENTYMAPLRAAHTTQEDVFGYLFDFGISRWIVSPFDFQYDLTYKL